MPLKRISLEPDDRPLPSEVAAFLRDVDERLRDLAPLISRGFRGFVPSDFVAAYRVMRRICEENLACGSVFCEWGSGLGVVTCLAAWLGFEAYGIEIDANLCLEAEALANDYDLPVEFIHGSFVPPGAEQLVDRGFAEVDGEYSLDTEPDDAYERLDLEIRDFDLIYAFPWPNDVRLVGKIFERFAADGSLLLTYHEIETFRLRRKV